MKPFAILADAGTDLVSYLLTAIGTMAATVVTLFWIREKERDKWFEKTTAATAAINANAEAIEALSSRLEALSREVARLNDEVRLLREKAKP